MSEYSSSTCRSSLRPSPDIVSGLTVLGFRTIGELSATPQAPLALRFGPEVGRRLDQMFGPAIHWAENR
jgi:protein ImuB